MPTISGLPLPFNLYKICFLLHNKRFPDTNVQQSISVKYPSDEKQAFLYSYGSKQIPAGHFDLPTRGLCGHTLTTPKHSLYRIGGDGRGGGKNFYYCMLGKIVPTNWLLTCCFHINEVVWLRGFLTSAQQAPVTAQVRVRAPRQRRKKRRTIKDWDSG